MRMLGFFLAVGCTLVIGIAALFHDGSSCCLEGYTAECNHECVLAVTRSGHHPMDITYRDALEACRASCPGTRRRCGIRGDR